MAFPVYKSITPDGGSGMVSSARVHAWCSTTTPRSDTWLPFLFNMIPFTHEPEARLIFGGFTGLNPMRFKLW